MVNLAAYLTELAVRYEGIAVYQNCLESLALRAKGHYLPCPDIVPQLTFSNTVWTLP